MVSVANKNENDDSIYGEGHEDNRLAHCNTEGSSAE